MLALLRGRLPPDLLPPSPPGYLATRLDALARGPCVEAFQWHGGGSWQGRPWSPDLPNDSALLLYLFAAFLATQGWETPLQVRADSVVCSQQATRMRPCVENVCT